MKKMLLNYFSIFIVIILVFYSFFAVLTYKNIQTQIEKLELLEERYVQAEANGEVPFKLRQDYEIQYNTYERQLSRVHSFWMKWVFDFPDFKTP